MALTAQSLLKKVFRRPLWQEPVTALILRAIDPVDGLVRALGGRRDLPPFSRRVRSNGLTGQFGGARFEAEGQHLVSRMREHAGLVPSSRVLEIGCGVGRSAIPLSRFLDAGRYVGMDIEKVSIGAFKANKALAKPNFAVEWLNIRNDLYNPEGEFEADEYRFPHADEAFDLIFHFSVFTHMMEPDVRNYAAEMARMTAPGGYCFFSTFLMEPDREIAGNAMPFRTGAAYHMREDIPEVMIGYDETFLNSLFEEHGLERSREPILGSWRGDSSVVRSDELFKQDIVIYRRPA